MTDDLSKRIDELEVQVTYQEDTIQSLNDVVADQSKQLALQAEDIAALKAALRRVSDRTPEPNVIGENAEEDPVPSSG